MAVMDRETARLLLLVYASSATREMTREALLTLLENARSYNESVGITGMLLHSGGNFIQALEGPEAEVRTLAARIARDPRHRHFTELLTEHTDERQFPRWSMGFKDAGLLSGAERSGLNSFLRERSSTDGFAADPHEAVFFLRTFRDVAR
jgi:hypothetical protein